MKKYKFIANSFPEVISKGVNNSIKNGWRLEEWKVNNNTIIVLLSKEKKQ